MGPKIEQVSSNKCFGGLQKVFKFQSPLLGCVTKFSVYLPPSIVADNNKKRPVLWFLSGLTCTEQNFIIESGFQRFAAQEELIVVGPDTSPRGHNIPGESDFFDLGVGAGFYVNATQEPWSKAWKMYDFVTKELHDIVVQNFPISEGKEGISGHSMGGHGAIQIGLKNPTIYKSISAFSPISNPSKTPMGQKAFKNYLGNDEKTWEDYDSSLLIKSYSGPATKILVHQGAADEYLEKELKVETLTEAAKSNDKVSVDLNMCNGYGHSYFFVGSHLQEHFKFHRQALE